MNGGEKTWPRLRFDGCYRFWIIHLKLTLEEKYAGDIHLNIRRGNSPGLDLLASCVCCGVPVRQLFTVGIMYCSSWVSVCRININEVFLNIIARETSKEEGHLSTSTHSKLWFETIFTKSNDQSWCLTEEPSPCMNEPTPAETLIFKKNILPRGAEPPQSSDATDDKNVVVCHLMFVGYQKRYLRITLLVFNSLCLGRFIRFARL